MEWDSYSCVDTVSDTNVTVLELKILLNLLCFAVPYIFIAASLLRYLYKYLYCEMCYSALKKCIW